MTIRPVDSTMLPALIYAEVYRRQGSWRLRAVGQRYDDGPAGLRHRVEVVGFDDVETADLLDPSLTVVAHDIAAMGRRAAEMLFARLDGSVGPPLCEVLPVSLLVRTRG